MYNIRPLIFFLRKNKKSDESDFIGFSLEYVVKIKLGNTIQSMLTNIKGSLGFSDLSENCRRLWR